MPNGPLKTRDSTLYRPLPTGDTKTTATISLGLHSSKVPRGSLLRHIIEVLQTEIISNDQFQVDLDIPTHGSENPPLPNGSLPPQPRVVLL